VSPVSTGDLGRLSRTVMQLRPAQIGQRVRLRAQRIALEHSVPPARRWLLSGPDPAAVTGWPRGYTPLDARLWCGGQDGVALRAGELRLIGVSRNVAADTEAGIARWASADWKAADAPLLWRFHLYYWDWAWALAAEPPCPDAPAVFTSIWESWHAAVVPGRGPAWHPNPAARRAWSFCGIYRALVQGGPVDGPFLGELAAHAGFLRRSLETDVGGNHLIKNLKALAGLAVFFADEALLARTIRQLRRQIAEQVLPDGGHYERAPAYHCQVLGDLIDIAGLLRAAGRPVPVGLPEAITAMRGWVAAVLTPRGEVPLLNDGFPVSPELLAAIAPDVPAAGAPAMPPAGLLHLLPDTGLARVAVGGWHVLADIGPPCPRELPAHAHADTLGCVVHVDAEPLLVDTGTSTYAPGPVRDRERSTAAHNTVEVDRRDSTEVWGAFRAGRRARVLGVSASADAGTVTVEGAHDGYRSLPGRPAHHRRWSVRAHELRVDDTVTGRGRHRVTVRWHLAPGTSLRLVPGGAVVTTAAGEIGVTVIAPGGPIMTASTAQISAGFARTVPAPLLTCTLHPELPVRIRTMWRRTETRQEPM
jgi:uncharacterized heparinase superfamily protein